MYRFLFTVLTKGMHTVNWGQNEKNHNTSQTVEKRSTKQTCSLLKAVLSSSLRVLLLIMNGSDVLL